MSSCVSSEGSSQLKSDCHPLFAFAFRDGVSQALQDFAAAEVAAGNADFIWVHLDLRDAAALAWLHRRPWPPKVIEMAATPRQRGSSSPHRI